MLGETGASRSPTRQLATASEWGNKGWMDERPTAPLVTWSWLLLPVTLKATLLGVLDLTSRVPAERW